MTISNLKDKIELIFPNLVSFQLDRVDNITEILIELDGEIEYHQLVRLSLLAETLDIRLNSIYKYDGEGTCLYNIIELKTSKVFEQ